MAGTGNSRTLTPGQWADAIVLSHLCEVGEPLCEPDELMDLAGVVLCHDASPDPRLVYTNLAAQRLWRRDWEDFVGLPSRLTAEPSEQAARADALSSTGVVHGYSGIRVAATGERFTISGATIWPVHRYSSDGGRGELLGQAATFSSWEFISSPETQRHPWPESVTCGKLGSGGAQMYGS